MSSKMTDDRKQSTQDTSKRKIANARKTKDHTAQKSTRPDKVEEIKAVWDSPNFKTNNQRLVYLLRHCHNIEYGYTIREFAHARFAEKMTPEPKSNDDYLWGEHYAFKALHMMFNRFRHDVFNHEVLLASVYKKLEKETVGRWYYYNIIDDDMQ